MSKQTDNGYGLHIIVIGNPVDGLEFYGPYNNAIEAAEVANSDGNLPDGDWWIAPLYAAEDAEER